MSGYGGNLTNHALTGTLVGKNISGYYLEPKTQWDFEKELPNYNDLSVNDILGLTPKNWKDNNDLTYWRSSEKIFFSGKDGQTNAYVKRGVDEELEEYMDRSEVRKYTWQVATDDPINFKSGGKVFILGKEWFILKVILQQTTGTYQNKFYSMDTSPENKRLQLIGVKTLVLA